MLLSSLISLSAPSRFILQMNSDQEDISLCPSFSSYSSDRLAEIAARVAANSSSEAAGTEDSGGGGDDFEFALVREDREISAAQLLYKGPVFPVFNRDLITENGAELSARNGGDRLESKNLIPLSKLFAEEDEERDSPPSCSSSEADELENIPAGTYCVWRPRMAEPPMPSQCKKSKSTGSASKRWKLRDLLRRSKSDGKESFVFLTPKHREEKPEKLMIQAPKKGDGGGSHSSAHEAFYVKNRAIKEGDKKKSYLPYRRDLVGLFGNVNGVRRSFSHI